MLTNDQIGRGRGWKAVRAHPKEPWMLMRREHAERARRLGFEVRRPCIFWRDLTRKTAAQVHSKVTAALRSFPGRTPARLRPNKKPEPGFTCPDMDE